MGESIQKNVFVQLFTNLGEDYALAAPSFSVISTATDRTLNDILAKMLSAQGKKGAIFDFLIEGKLIRGEIASYQKEGASESKLQVEYILGIGEPKEDGRAPAPRVAAKIVLYNGHPGARYLTGCFDGFVEWRNSALEVVEECSFYPFDDPLQGSILCYDFVETEEEVKVYAGNAWSEILFSSFSTKTNARTSFAKSPTDFTVVSLLAYPFAPLIYAGDCHGNISILSSDRLRQQAAARLMNSTITSIKTAEDGQILVSARDDLMKLCDAQSLMTLTSFPCKDSAVTASECIMRLSLCFSGHATGTIRSFDKRQPETPTQIFKSHSYMVSQVAFNYSTDYQFASACHGGMISVWDLRSDRCVYEIDAASQHKIYSLLWESRHRLISAGEDSTIVAHKFN